MIFKLESLFTFSNLIWFIHLIFAHSIFYKNYYFFKTVIYNDKEIPNDKITHLKYLNIIRYLFYFLFLYVNLFLFISDFVFESLFISIEKFWIVNCSIYFMGCFLGYFYLFNKNKNAIYQKIKNPKVNLNFKLELEFLLPLFFGYVNLLLPYNLVNRNYVEILIITLNLLGIVLQKKIYYLFIGFNEYFDDIYVLKKELSMIKINKENKSKIKNLKEKIVFLSLKTIKFEKKKNWLINFKDRYKKTFLLSGTQDTWNSISQILFIILFFVPIIFLVLKIIMPNLVQFNFFDFLLVQIGQSFISFRLFNRKKQFLTKSFIRAIFEILIFCLNFYIVYLLFIDPYLYFNYQNLYYISYFVWNLLILIEYDNLSAYQKSTILNAMSVTILMISNIFIINKEISNLSPIFNAVLPWFVFILFLITSLFKKQMMNENLDSNQKKEMYYNIKSIFEKLESYAGIYRDYSKRQKLKEKHMRDYFASIFEEREEQIKIESISKSQRPSDLKIILKKRDLEKASSVTIEFKIWKRHFKGMHHPITEIIDNMGSFEEFGIVIIFSFNDKSILEKYMEDVENHYSYEKNSLIPYYFEKNENLEHLISNHNTEIGKTKQILHMIYYLKNIK